MELAEQYPLLHSTDRWEWASITMSFTTTMPPDELISNTHVVAFVGEEVLMCRAAGGNTWFLPGGTREPGESVDASLRRELLEEAGGHLVGEFHPLGAHVGVADSAEPYRPHLPHPEKAWLWGWAEACIVGLPTNPADAEQVTEVRTFPLDEAVRRAVTDFAWSGELVRFAAASRCAAFR